VNTPAPNNTALLLRSLALFAVLYQIRLIAGDLADTAMFASALTGAYAAAAFLSVIRVNEKKTGPAAAIAAIALIPWFTRALVAMPRLLFPGRTDSLAAALDSLLLNLDRNNFVSLLPFYWIAFTSWFSIRSRAFLRGAVVADAALLLLVFSIARTVNIAMYRWPVVTIAMFAGIVFTQILALLFSLPPEIRLRKIEAAGTIAVLLLLIVTGSLLFFRPLQERAVEKGGGLLEPKLFSFDFSRFLRLDSEISMNDDLILIVKKEADDNHILLRRSVLSGYSKKQGFYRIEEFDERTHPLHLPERPAGFNRPSFQLSRRVMQEYFLVNFDAAAFIGMKEPVFVTPYESWDASSFSSAYAVESVISDARFADLARSTLEWPDVEALGLSEEEFAVYTEYDRDERIRSCAEDITRGLDRYSDKVRKIYNWLKHGDFRYSLKPGIAPDEDQLMWFLFNSKKGYCSYYAFAMALLLRSQGIPARIAAGFFVDPKTNTFNYYPVRSDMAHAWVEIPFPGYGWIEFDPTTEKLAEGEEFRFSNGVDPDLFERLMREILENRSRLRARQGQETAAPASSSGSLARSAAAFLRKAGPPLLPVLLALLFIGIRCGFLFAFFLYKDRRKRAICLWNHCKRRLGLAGLGRNHALAEAEWARQNDSYIEGIYAMYQGVAAARFALEFSEEDRMSLWNTYRSFSAAYRKKISAGRRILAWLLPPLALVLGPGKYRILPVLLLVFLAGSNTMAQVAGESPLFMAADELYNQALDAEYAQFWERAIGLLKEGGEKFPGDPRFPRTLGDLYYSRSLYNLAWDEYRKAESINPFDTDILMQLAHTAGYLNRDNDSVEYLERLLLLDADNREAISNLGWMYYKVHRLKEGEALLNQALERFGDDPNLSMTLGTVYSDMYYYDESKYWYQQAIAQGEALWDRGFTAVGYYNLSILESRFYRFDLSLQASNASLESENRASGHLARGEIYLRQLELEKSRADYESAYEIDTSPLAKINLAQIYQISGRLEEARLYAEDCLKTSDLSWMMNYGIDPDRYKRDIHEILYKTYAGLARTERCMPWGRPGEKIRSLFRLAAFRFKSRVNRKLYLKYSLAAGDAYRTVSQPDGTNLDVFIQYYNAFEDYPRRALAWLNGARNFETAIIPAAGPSYDLEEGALMKNETLVSRALAALDPVWEREMISQCYRYLARFGASGKPSPEQEAFRQALVAELFVLNQGALRQAGIGLPVEINVNLQGRNGKSLLAALKKAGFKPAAPGAKHRLDIAVSGSAIAGYTVSCEFSSGTGGKKSQIIPLRSFSYADICGLARTIGNAVFKTE
jgi:tetratricopeptide (TPR) repeat protein